MSKQKIFNTTLELVEQNDLNISVRQIAKAADVNVGAVNYHFGSKENLIKEIIKHKLEKLSVAFDLILDEDIENFEKLELFLCNVIELIMANPEIADYVINQENLFETRYEYQQYLNTVGYLNLESLIKEITGINDSYTVTMITEHVLAACILTYVKQVELSKQNTDFEVDEDYKKRVNFFINNYFYKYRK